MDQHPDPAREEQLALIATIRAWILATPEPSMADLEAMRERLQPLTESPDFVVSEAAGRVELRLLGAILAAQGLAMRAIGEKVRQLARWLPPDQPRNN